MDSVFIFFADATHEEVEAAIVPFGFRNEHVARGADQFYFRRYSSSQQASELEPHEAQAIESLLGSSPQSAFEVATRHGPSAVFALEVVSKLMQQFAASALHDDFGNLFPSSSVVRLYTNHPAQGIYALRELPSGKSD
jgi:hypothetical protein